MVPVRPIVQDKCKKSLVSPAMGSQFFECKEGRNTGCNLAIRYGGGVFCFELPLAEQNPKQAEKR